MTSLCLEVRGEYACFTRPELKVERVSYDVMTPSAARAIFESILWKPAIRWEVGRIDVLRPIAWIAIRRNEVATKFPFDTVRAAMAGASRPPELVVDDDRQQRAALLLRDVAYRVWAQPVLTARADPADRIEKYIDIFRRRADRGQCVNQPYLGCREFACSFDYVADTASRPRPIDETRDLGVMLFDLDFAEPARPIPLFFRARLEAGTLRVPSAMSAEVLR